MSLQCHAMLTHLRTTDTGTPLLPCLQSGNELLSPKISEFLYWDFCIAISVPAKKNSSLSMLGSFVPHHGRSKLSSGDNLWTQRPRRQLISSPAVSICSNGGKNSHLYLARKLYLVLRTRDLRKAIHASSPQYDNSIFRLGRNRRQALSNKSV